MLTFSYLITIFFFLVSWVFRLDFLNVGYEDISSVSGMHKAGVQVKSQCTSKYLDWIYGSCKAKYIFTYLKPKEQNFIFISSGYLHLLLNLMKALNDI